jgi:predicted ATPase
MIHNLHITNYRAFERLSVEPLQRVNLIVGTNNAGKTSLLEAVYLLASQHKQNSLATILQERGEFLSDVQDSWLGRVNPTQIRWNQIDGYLVAQLFHGRASGVHTPITIQSKAPPTMLALSIGNGQDPQADSDYLIVEIETNATKSTAEKIKLDSNILPPFARWKRDLQQPGGVRFMTTNFMDYAEMANLWDRIVLTPSEESVVDALRLIEPCIERISFTGGRTSYSGILVRLQGEETPIPLDSMGDGVRRILAITVALVSIGQGTMLIDEIDTGLYYAVLKDMWRVVIETAMKQDAQVFATTHSWDCVKAFQQALSLSSNHSQGSLIRLDRDGEQIKVTTYTADELDIAISQGIEVR